MYILGIAGGSGSGKTTLAEAVAAKFPDDVLILHHDDYYRCRDHMTMEEREKINYDHPNALETDLLVSDLRKLKNGETVIAPTYDFAQHTRSATVTRTLTPHPVVIVEGILIFENPELVAEMDAKVFVDVDADVAFSRRVLRDCNERGRTLEGSVEQYLTTTKPMFEQFVAPSKKNADIIVCGGGRNPVARDLLCALVEKSLQK